MCVRVSVLPSVAFSPYHLVRVVEWVASGPWTDTQLTGTPTTRAPSVQDVIGVSIVVSVYMIGPGTERDVVKTVVGDSSPPRGAVAVEVVLESDRVWLPGGRPEADVVELSHESCQVLVRLSTLLGPPQRTWSTCRGQSTCAVQQQTY